MSGRNRRGGRAAALVGLAASALLVAAVPSHANNFTLGNFRYVKGAATIPAAGPDETTFGKSDPRCGKGWDVTGGGGNPKGLPGHTRLTTVGFEDDHHVRDVHLGPDVDGRRLREQPEETPSQVFVPFNLQVPSANGIGNRPPLPEELGKRLTIEV
jgi:hypothetical protein